MIDSAASTATFGWNNGTVDVVASVYDGGTPGTNGDTYDHGIGDLGTCTGGSFGPYPIVSGNLTVH